MRFTLASLESTIDDVVNLTRATDESLGKAMHESGVAGFNAIRNCTQYRWLHPTIPITPTQNRMNDMRDDLMSKIEAVLGTRCSDVPNIEITTASGFLPRINDSERLINKQLGISAVGFTSPPTMCFDQETNTIILPATFLISIPSNENNATTDHVIQEHQWEQSYLEEALCEELTHSLFRQMRGEIRSDYYRCFKNIGSDAMMEIKHNNEAISERVRAIICLQDKADWGVFIASELLQSIQQCKSQIAYRAVKALESSYTLAQISMIDTFQTVGAGQFQFSLYRNHPNFETKKQLLGF
jgi:hypothetical protein